MANPIKMGLVGLGRAGWGMHLREIRNKTDLFRVVAACDILEDRNQLVKDRLGCRTYTSIEELLKDEEVELVSIATRSCDHFLHAKMALEAGKDVLLEKPACTDYEDFKLLLSMANKPGKPRLFFRQNRRFEKGFQELSRIIKAGLLGHVFELRLNEYGYQRRDDWQTLSRYGGGQMHNWGPHLIDHALQLLGSSVVKVNANLIHGAAGGDCEDHFSIQLTAENGCYATVSVSGSVAMDGGRIYTVYGDKGAAVMHDKVLKLRYIDPQQQLPPVESDPGTPANEFGATGTFEAAAEPRWIEVEMELTGEDLKQFWDHLYESYRNGKPFPIKDEEVDALMRVIALAKQNPIVEAKKI